MCGHVAMLTASTVLLSIWANTWGEGGGGAFNMIHSTYVRKIVAPYHVIVVYLSLCCALKCFLMSSDFNSVSPDLKSLRS